LKVLSALNIIFEKR